MFSLGFFEIVALAVIALVVVGPERLPTMARNIGRFLTELKRTTNTITSEINAQIDEEKFYADTKAPVTPVSVAEDSNNLGEPEALDNDHHEREHHDDHGHEYDHDHNHNHDPYADPKNGDEHEQ